MQKFKQILLSLGVIVTFVAYSIQQRGEAKPVITAPSPVTSPQPLTVNGGEGEDDGTVIKLKNNPVATPPPTAGSTYKNGSYTGNAADAYYGFIQVRAIVSNGKISDVVFLNHPSDNPTSQYINSQAMPMLKQEAITAQSANVNIITGATDTSLAFQQSLANALSQAKL